MKRVSRRSLLFRVIFENAMMVLIYGSCALFGATPFLSAAPVPDLNDIYWDEQFLVPGANGMINAIAVAENGDVYVGGDPDKHIARP